MLEVIDEINVPIARIADIIDWFDVDVLMVMIVVVVVVAHSKMEFDHGH